MAAKRSAPGGRCPPTHAGGKMKKPTAETMGSMASAAMALALLGWPKTVQVAKRIAAARLTPNPSVQINSASQAKHGELARLTARSHRRKKTIAGTIPAKPPKMAIRAQRTALSQGMPAVVSRIVRLVGSASMTSASGKIRNTSAVAGPDVQTKMARLRAASDRCVKLCSDTLDWCVHQYGRMARSHRNSTDETSLDHGGLSAVV